MSGGINYSLRPSKSIQRSIVFEGIRQLQGQLNLEEMIYIGFGSVWFVDFQIAHKALGIKKMISIEGGEIEYRRACFNKPFQTVSVEEGISGDVLPKLFGNVELTSRPWTIWLDYTRGLEDESISDIRGLIENAPPDSIILVTINASGGPYGRPAHRIDRLKALLGGVVPDDLTLADCRDDELPKTIAKFLLAFMTSVAASISRPGGFVPLFSIVYRDTTKMVTIGGVLPSKGSLASVKMSISKTDWPGFVAESIDAPHLTLKEVATLQAQLPTENIDRSNIQGLGFDLEEAQIKTFQKYYKIYPSYAQILI